MTDRPIIFSAPMIRALLEGRKTQTRRVLKPQPVPFIDEKTGKNVDIGLLHVKGDPLPRITLGRGITLQEVPYAVGDRLWVREAHYRFGHWEPDAGKLTKTGKQKWKFVADTGDVLFDPPDDFEIRNGRRHRDPYTPAWHKRLGRFMFRNHSRLTLVVTDVKVERLRDISETDARAEGVEHESADPPFYYVPGIWPHSITAVGIEEPGGSHAARSYAKLWNHINGPGAWEANPWVVALSFTVHQGNIDRLVAA